MEEEGPESEELQLIYDRLEALEPAQLETKAGELLYQPQPPPPPNPPPPLPQHSITLTNSYVWSRFFQNSS